MMKITNKPAWLSKSLRGHNIRMQSEDGDEGGDAGELVPAKSVRLTKVMLTKGQFNELLDGKLAYNAFFDDGTKPPSPAWPRVSYLPINEQWKDCEAEISFGVSNKSIALEGAKVKNVRIVPREGGVGELQFTLVATFPRKLETLDLEQFYGKEVTLTLKFGEIDDGDEASKQDSLALEDHESTDKPIDKTRVLTPGQAEREAETERQLSEALRGLEKQDAEAEEKAKNGRKRSTEPRVN